MRQINLLILIFLLQAGVVNAQDSDVKKLVDAMRNARTEMLVQKWKLDMTAKGITAPMRKEPEFRYHILMDNEPISDSTLNKLTLVDITQVAFSFDPVLMLIGGDVGLNGVIVITRKKTKP